jgi:hypothetical protein
VPTVQKSDYRIVYQPRRALPRWITRLWALL